MKIKSDPNCKKHQTKETASEVLQDKKFCNLLIFRWKTTDWTIFSTEDSDSHAIIIIFLLNEAKTGTLRNPLMAQKERIYSANSVGLFELLISNLPENVIVPFNFKSNCSNNIAVKKQVIHGFISLFAKDTNRANSSASFFNLFNFKRQPLEYLQQGS